MEDINFSALTNLKPADISISQGDAYAMGSDQLIFGWAVNTSGNAAAEVITLTNVPEGEYLISLYDPWTGNTLKNHIQASVFNNDLQTWVLSDSIPELSVTGGVANHVGADIAIKIRPAGR